MIDDEMQKQIAYIIKDPGLSLPEINEKLAKLKPEYEDILYWITYNFGDDRFKQIIGKHRGITKRTLQG